MGVTLLSTNPLRTRFVQVRPLSCLQIPGAHNPSAQSLQDKVTFVRRAGRRLRQKLQKPLRKTETSQSSAQGAAIAASPVNENDGITTVTKLPELQRLELLEQELLRLQAMMQMMALQASSQLPIQSGAVRPVVSRSGFSSTAAPPTCFATNQGGLAPAPVPNAQPPPIPPPLPPMATLVRVLNVFLWCVRVSFY